MDLIAAYRVLVEIDERGSVTRAAAALDVAQSVASRRILALERQLGAPLLERNARHAVLTAFGRDLVPSARRLVRLADEVELDAERARLRPVTVAVPTGCSTRDLAVTVAAGSAAGLRLEFRAAPPPRRAELASTLAVRVAVLAVPVDEAEWVAELGAAGRRPSDRALRLEALRPSRRGRSTRDADAGARIRIAPEDDLPHLRDPLTRAAYAAGLLPGQLPVDASVTSALAAVLADGDLLLCTSAEARDLGLHWRPFTGLPLARGFALAGDSAHDVDAVRTAVADELAAALGAEASRG
ncbi:LysR family transcriptional regulator [Leifsonia sp. PS1209]|uniref:LysR family transcriptional regulator n=1 Tax=Leifsonia sp. PS1209 TaxID=2724914 RepID=UPI001442C010|nr:LysR family transcriptional regulator [Leifsonia sp. PS1209]QJA00254.1 LysR family transcriptional regulator [Leifsonia sp. PS1209]